MPITTPLVDRFWSKVNKDGPNGCWEWQATKNGRNYGLYRPGGLAEKQLAHRICYQSINGPIPDGMFVCHRCDNPSCVNPAHLWLGTHSDNMLDMYAKGRCERPRPRGVLNPRAKLTEDDVRSIRAQMQQGRTPRHIARDFSVSSTMIRRIRDGKAWKHVT